MATYADGFSQLVALYKQNSIEFPQLKAVTAAQWLLESGRGFSGLALLHSNFAGMKWRPEMKPYAKRVLFDAPSEKTYFCSFFGPDSFISGYWAFLERAPYKGWRDHAYSPYAFIEFIGPIWAADKNYVDKVLDLLPEGEALIGAERSARDRRASSAAEEPAPCCSGMADDLTALTRVAKPPVEFIESPYHFSRNGAQIEYIVLHYTTTRSLQSTIDHFLDNDREVACHYIVSRDGKIVQMVADDRKCIHGNSKNSTSIGIEHSAAQGDQITEAQEDSSLALIRWLQSEYGVTTENIIPHKCAPRATRCPGELFEAYGANGESSCAEHHAAVQSWLAEKL